MALACVVVVVVVVVIVISSVFLSLTTDKDYLQLNFTSTLAKGNTDSKRQSFPVHTMKANVGSRSIVPVILHIGTTVNFTSRPHYPWKARGTY